MEKYGFVYIWYDRKHKRYYIGSHWGTEDDGYICSSKWMKQSFKRRPSDFKRRILSNFSTKKETLLEERRYLSMIDSNEFGKKYYNLKNNINLKQYDMRVGLKHSEETKKKISISKKQNPTRYWLGKTRSEETKKKLSLVHTGKTQSLEHRQKNSRKIKDLWNNPSWREKMLESRKKKNVSELYI